jgi:HEAT repeat protein
MIKDSNDKAESIQPAPQETSQQAIIKLGNENLTPEQIFARLKDRKKSVRETAIKALNEHEDEAMAKRILAINDGVGSKIIKGVNTSLPILQALINLNPDPSPDHQTVFIMKC